MIVLNLIGENDRGGDTYVTVYLCQLIIVYFDHQTGDLHAVYRSKSYFLAILHLFPFFPSKEEKIGKHM